MNNSKQISSPEHDKYAELCAVALTGELSSDEWQLLRNHIAMCDGCRHQIQSYHAMVNTFMPAGGAAEATPADRVRTHFSWWSRRRAKRKLLRAAGIGAPRFAFGALHRSRLGLGLASAAALAIAAAILLAHSPTRFRRPSPSAGEIRAQVPESKGRSIQAEAVAEAPAPVTPAELQILRQRVAQQTKRIEELIAANRSLQAGLVAEKQNHELELATMRQASFTDRAELSNELADAKARLASSKTDLERAVNDNVVLQAELRDAHLQVVSLTAKADTDSKTIAQQQDLMSSERDIRELVGARDLLIADVTDADGNSGKKQAFGRIFYTKGKSLVFYAFDLDQQRGGRKNASFQAWGIRGDGSATPVNLGVLYQDNETKKRWVLKFDNSTELASLHGIYVTAEPQGGSQSPTGRQLLYASLLREPNHP
jgi:hypothetical protein